GVATMIIAVPTGVKIFNWLFTMYGGRVVFATPVLWAIGFVVTFVIGGMTGVLLAVPPADFVLHNSLFLVAHFHNVIIGGVLFGLFAGYEYWFPKAFGFKLHEGIGKAAFWFWIVGFYVAFMPLYWLGLMGATRRMNHYPDTGWQPLMVLAWAGAVVIAAGIGLMILQLVVSIRTRAQRLDTTGDPWNGRTLEWATPSPPPAWNFDALPQVKGLDAFWQAKHGEPDDGIEIPADANQRSLFPGTHDRIELPAPSEIGLVIAFFASVGGFAMVWHMFWLGTLSLLGIVGAVLWQAWRGGGHVAVEPRAVRAPAGTGIAPEVAP
ncbi:MAG: cbb3-type cytochrome c oxidase subunit I, partial [Rubrivivax sp.]